MSIEEKQARVLRAAYEWRYAIITPGSDVKKVENELISAVDELDIEEAYGADE